VGVFRDALFLSRLQSFWVVALPILLPALTVGLASYIALLEGPDFTTRRPADLRVSQFCLKVFGVSFGLGVGP
jgi:cytochrome d ubiquinol oxidase subunit I